MRIVTHQFVPFSKRQEYADAMSEVDGKAPDLNNIATPFDTVPAGPCAQWDTFKGYTGGWYGTSSGYDASFAQALMTAANGTEAWFVAVLEDGTVVNENLTPSGVSLPATVSFWTIAQAIGLTLRLST